MHFFFVSIHDLFIFPRYYWLDVYILEEADSCA